MSEDFVIVEELEDSAAGVGVGPLAVPTETLPLPHPATVTTSRKATAAREPVTSPPIRTTDEHNGSNVSTANAVPSEGGRITSESMATGSE